MKKYKVDKSDIVIVENQPYAVAQLPEELRDEFEVYDELRQRVSRAQFDLEAAKLAVFAKSLQLNSAVSEHIRRVNGADAEKTAK